MSLIPFILDLADELHEINRSLASGMDVDDFGFGMYPQELHQTRRPRTVSQFYLLPNSKARHHPYYRGGKACCNKAAVAASQLHEPEKDSSSAMSSSNDKESVGNGNGTGPGAGAKPAAAAYSVVNKNGFQVSMNVKQFSPNELTVKTIENCIIVEGKHDEKEDGHGVISRHFVRKYVLPKGFDPNDVLSTLSSDGILTVKAPPPPPPAKAEEQEHERVVHIQHTGPTQLSVKENNNTNNANNNNNNNTNNNKEKVTTQPTTTTAAALPAQTPTPVKPQTPIPLPNASQQQQQQSEEQQQQQQKPSQPLQVPKERNGDANANELSGDQETETEVGAGPVSGVEPLLLASSSITPVPMDADVSASVGPAAAAVVAAVTGGAVAAPAGAGGAVGVSGGGGGAEENNDNGIADIPMAVSSIPASVAAGTEAVPSDGAPMDGVLGADNGAAAADVSVGVGIEMVGELPAENIVIPTPPSAGDLVAAADAAILLAKTQCENGNKSAVDEMAN